MERIVIEFSDPASVRPGFALLVAAAGNGTLQIRDLEFLHSIYGVAGTVSADRVDPVLAGLDGAASGLFNRAELDAIAADLPHGHTAAALAYDGTIAPVLAAWESGGAVSRTLPASC